MSTEGDANELITEDKYDEADKRKRFVETEKRKVLIYNAEGGGKTTESFITALIQTLQDFECKDFYAAKEEEQYSLPIIAVVRHTSTRMEEILKELKDKFDKKEIKNLKRIIVTYFYMKGQEEATYKTHKESEFVFAKVIVLDYIDNNLGKTGIFNGLLCRRKPRNETALEELKATINLVNTKMTWSADVFIESDLSFVKQFFDNLEQDVSQSIRFKKVETFEKLEHGTSPTLIFISGDQNGFLKRLKEKDARKVFLVKIIDSATTFEVPVDTSDDTVQQTIRSAQCTDAEKGNKTAQVAENMPMQNGNIWKVVHWNGTFLEERHFLKSVQSFILTFPCSFHCD